MSMPAPDPEEIPPAAVELASPVDLTTMTAMPLSTADLIASVRAGRF